ncbi:bifunctional 2-polyprenyl-6-hydroxyphenol methylase/3-demethylubiquinol 3-O-methyltransferase UbiG [Salinibacter ruber]|uniref:Methyltransferase domain protein n=1 Tax=Salinibacter ruber (strain DSM 13855 / M31) TaxID=309807 RepID=Q2S4X6_SALRD|nr:class I SAM-dependent methyltransferase [Salinibacter ruber]ABC45280.1 methyltransferase domain protein [Salinibacter ruber DSM 13855]
MGKTKHASDYVYSNAKCGRSHDYLLPRVEAILDDLQPNEIFDLGCGNGSVMAHLVENGYNVTGVDPSEEGITEAKKAFPYLDVHIGSAYDDLSRQYGQYDVTLSLEVVEHVYYPRKYADTVFNLTRPGGHAIISTPYHGYLKNLLIALMGEWGHRHYSPFWTNGHIKIWSPSTLKKLLREAGFKQIRVHRVGRLPSIAKSMIVTASKVSE